MKDEILEITNYMREHADMGISIFILISSYGICIERRSGFRWIRIQKFLLPRERYCRQTPQFHLARSNCS
jgi:hypothetical protein